jgi:large subunit ribosomal protein L15e
MGYLKYVKQAFRNPSEEIAKVQRDRLLQFRDDPEQSRIEHPTRIDKARALGYRAKHGIFVVRQRVRRGSHTRANITGGRRPSRSHQTKNLHKNYQHIAEERVATSYVNCEVLGSYPVAEDGYYLWYESILVDKSHPEILADKRLIGIAAQTGRTFRGLTSAGRKARGLRRKGNGSEKTRPSSRQR